MKPANLILAAYVALIAALLFGTPAHSATRCRSTSGRFIKCPPPPAPAPVPTPPSYTVPAAIPDNFDTALAIEPFDNGGSLQGKVADLSHDPVGAFRIVCPPNPMIVNDDPLVYPGKPGASHAHSSGVNSRFDAFADYKALRSGGSGCGAPESISVYRSSFWFPAMLDGAGHYVLPDYFNTYYKQLPASHPDCQRRAQGCVPLPAGMSFITGWNVTTGKGGPMDPYAWDQWFDYFECWKDDNTSERAVDGRWHNIADAVKAGCPAGSLLIMQIGAPECWDGVNADSPDHRSHLAFPSVDITPAGEGNQGRACDAAHPYLIPLISVRAVFTTDANFAAGKWHLSCDDMTGGLPAGSCLHFDYREAWSPAVKATWQAHCIDEHLTCSGGDLGNGTQIKGLKRDNTWVRHQLVPVP